MVGSSEKKSKQQKDTTGDVVGGFAFFLSLVALLPTGLIFFTLAIAQVRGANITLTAIFLASCLLGAILAQVCIRGHISVLLHEFKHSLISNLVGNKFKEMQINEHSGHVSYSYTKRTAHYNAFIALAPYITPVFTFVSILIAIACLRHTEIGTLMIVGLAYGADLLLNTRDISPVQTDITLIRGGYSVGLLYIAAWNFILAALILAWALQGTEGLLTLLEASSRFFFAIYFAVSGTGEA